MSYYDRPDSILNRAALNIRKPDEQEPDPMLDPDSDSFAFADLPRDTSTKAMDYVRAFKNGFYAAPGALGDFAETTGKKLRQSGQNQSIPGLDILQQTGGALLEAVGSPIRFIGEKINNFGHEELSPGAQNAMQDGTIPGIVLEATQATGSLAGDAIAGGAIRKGLTVAQKAGTYASNFWRNYSKTGNPSVSAMVAAKAENAVKTPGLTPYIAGTSLAHAQGGAFESVRQSVRQLSPQELAENEEFVREFTALRNDPKHQQLSDPDIYGMAIQSFADQAAMNLSTDPRLIALNVVATATGTVPLLKTVFKGASRPLAAMATGLAREGIVNAGQEAGTQYLINEAQNNLGFSIDSQEGVADAAKRGFATGGLMGLAGGGISGTRYRLQQRAEQNARLESRKNADSTLAEKYQRAQDIMQPQQPRAAEPSATDTTAQPQTADSLPQDMLKQIREMDYQQATTYTASAELAIARGDTSRIPAAQAAHSRMEQLSIQQDIDELKKIPQRNEAENHELSGLEQRLNHITRQLSGQTAEHQPQNPRTDGVQTVLPPPQLTALPAPGNIHPGRGFPMPGKPGLSATDERAPDGHRFTTRKIIASKTGKPFRGSGSARASQTFRQAQAQGLNPAVIKQGRENYVIEADAPAVPHKAVTQAQAPAADIPPQATPRVQTAEPPAPPQNAGHNYMAEPDNKTPSPVAAERKTAPPPQAEKPQVKQQAEPESHKPVNSEEDLQTRPARPEEANHLTGERNAAPKASKGEKTPSQAEAQKPAKTESPRTAEKSGEKIDDFGETIHGAAKHRRAALSEELNTERTAEDYKTQLFSTLKTKETDKGVVFYSKDLNKEAFKVPEEQAQRYRTELAKALNNKKTHEQYISVSDTPAVLRHLGAPDLPLSISKNVVTKAIKDKHEVMIKTISRLPELIHNPRAVYRSATKDNAFVILLDSKDRKGNPVVSAIHLSFVKKTSDRPGGQLEINNISSVYGTKGGREKIQKMEHDGLAVYRRNPDDSLILGLQLPGQERFHQGSATKVLHAGDIGNKNNVNPGYAKQADKPQHLDMKTVAGIAKEFVDRYKGNLNLNVRVYRTQEAAYGDKYNYTINGSYDADAQKVTGVKKGTGGDSQRTYENSRSIQPVSATGNVLQGLPRGDKSNIRGLVRLNASAFTTKAEVETTLRHEILGHYGLNTFSAADKLAILKEISKTTNNPDYASLWNTVKTRYPDLENYNLAQSEEVFAHAAQLEKAQRTARTGKRIIPSSVIHAFHQALRKSGLVRGEMPIKELYDAIDAVSDGIRAGRRPQINFPEKNGYQFGRYLQRHGSGLISDTGKSPAGSKIQGMSVKQVQVITGSMMKDIADKDLRVKVVKTQAEAEALAGEKTGDRIHAMYQPHNNTIVMVADNLQMGMVREKLRHELIHHALEKLITPQQHAGLLKAIGDTRASKNPEIQRVWRQVEQNYAGSSKDIQTAEFLSHMAEHHQPGKYGIYWNRAVNAIKNLLHKAGLISDTTFNDLHQLKETLHTLGQRLRSGYIADNSASTGNTAHARQAKPDPFKVPEGEGERYRAELAKAMKSHRSSDISMTISSTPAVLRHLGAPDLPLIISRDTVRKATNGVKHVVPMNVIERLPELMHDPEAVYRSATQDNALVVLMNAKDKNGDPVVSAVHLQASAQRIEINRIASVYGAFPGKLTKMDREGLALYKKQNPGNQSAGVLQLHGDSSNRGSNPDDSQYSGLQLPKEERFQQGSDKKILHSGDIRNSEGKTFYAKQKDFSIEAPEETYAKLLVRKLQDKFRILKDVQDNIRKAGGKIDEASDAYLAEELHYGKTENDLTRIQQRYIEPLAKLLADYKISREQLDEYLYARHAKERNAHIAEINPDNPQLQDGGSGMTNAEADRILRRIKSGGQQTKFDRLAGIIDDMLKDRRELLENYGLEDADIIHTWQKSYKYYVPLKGWAASPAEFSRGNKRALGRTSQAQSPSVQAIQDLTESIIRARKNEVGNALLKLVTDNPDKNYWQIFTQEQPDRTKYAGNIKDAKTGKIRQEVRTRAVNMQNNPKYFATKVNGKTWYIKFADQRLMDAMQTLSTQNPGWVLRKMAGINRFMSRLATSLSPVFLVRNFIRDQSTAHMFIQAEATRNDGRLRGISNPTLFALKTQRDSFAAMRAIYTDLRASKPDAGGATWQKYWRDFQEDGAKTGWIQSPGFSEAAKRMDNIIAMHSEGFRGMSSGVLNSLGKLIEDGNSAVENALRLSAYRHAIESGISRQQAASLAKNLTVNFNRRGEWGVYLNSLYMFANASVQGTANVARAFFYLDGNGPLLQRLRWKNLNNAQKIGIVSFAASFALSSLNRVAGGQDDDGRYWYDKVPQYDREHNLIIMKSLFGMGKPGAYWKIPLPYGYNWFWHLADNASSVLSGGKTAGEATRQSISSAFGAFSPVGSEESQTIPGTVFKNAVPSVFRPAYSLLTNENFAGQPITQKRFPGDTRPDSATGKRSTGEAYKTFSRWLNRVTGGDDTISGSFDISPDQLSYLVASYTSSPGRLIDQTIDLAAKTASGKTADINPQQIPFRGIHNSQVMPYADTNRLYSNLEELSQIQAGWKSLAGTGEKRAQFRERWKNELGMTALAKQTRSQLQAISRQRNAIYASPHLTGQQVSERLRQLDKQAKTITDKFNKTWDQRAKK